MLDEEKNNRNSHHKQLVFYEDPLGLLELGVLPLVAPSQVVHVEQHDLERKQNLKKEKRKEKVTSMAVATLASCCTAPYCSEEEATLPVDWERTAT